MMAINIYSDNPAARAMNRELERQSEQRASVIGKDPQYRVEYRFPRGTKHWYYYLTLEDAQNAKVPIQYVNSPFGVEPRRPTSYRVQKKGPRGGWSKA